MASSHPHDYSSLNRLPGLDLLRATAIVWVMFFHSYLVGGLGDHFSWLSRYGWAGVDIFFSLSGFLIGAQLLSSLKDGTRSWSISRFYARRAWRILPAYAVVLAVYVWFPSAREAPGLQFWWQFATFSMNCLVDYDKNQAFSHAWSLCVEEHFYLVFPFLAVLFSRHPSLSRLCSWSAAVVMCGIVLRSAMWIHDTATNPNRNWYIEDLYYPTWMRLDGILVGVFLAALCVYWPLLWRRLQSHATYCAMVGIAMLSVALWMFRDRVGFMPNAVGWPLLSIGIGLVIPLASSRTGVLSQRIPGLSWLASISYSLYLSHKIAFHFVKVHLEANLPAYSAIHFAAYAIAALALGALLHYSVELPFLRIRDVMTNSNIGTDATSAKATG